MSMFYLISTHESPERVKESFSLDVILPAENLGDSHSLDTFAHSHENLRIGILGIHEDIIANLLAEGYPVAIIEGQRDYIHSGYRFKPLPQEFFANDAKYVARKLLGKLLVRKLQDEYIIGKIVETEAYYGENDPASRARKGMRDYNKAMWLPGGHIFIYMVHANWMLNLTTDYDEAQAVLIRAVEPLAGIYLMKERRKRNNIKELCSGPGKLSQSFYIHKNMNGEKLGASLLVADSPWRKFEIRTSNRIGVSEDLEEHLRFFIFPNRFVSRRNK